MTWGTRARASPPALFTGVGGIVPGIEILLLTLRGKQAVGEPARASVFFFFMGGGMCAVWVMHKR